MQDKNTINELNNNVNIFNDTTIVSGEESVFDWSTIDIVKTDAKGKPTTDQPYKNREQIKDNVKVPNVEITNKQEAMRQKAHELAVLDDAWVLSELKNIAKELKCSKSDLEKMWKAEKKKLKPPAVKQGKKGFVIEPSNDVALQPNASIEMQYTHHQDKTQFRNDELNTTYYWNNVYWEHFDLVKGQKHAYVWLKTKTDQYYANAKKAESCFKTLQLDLENLPPTGQDIIVSVKNGWLKLNQNHQLEVMKPDRQYNICSATKIELDLPESGIYEPLPVPDHSDFYRYLNTALPDIQDQELLQEYAGYTFSSDKRFQNFILNIGGGGNGKGTMLHILEKIHHEPKSAVLNTKDFDLEHLIHASLMTVGDASQETNVEMLKETTGGDTSMVRQKHKVALSVELKAKWWINANEPPRWNDTTNAIWTRILPIKWEGKFREYGKCDPALEANIIANELSIVLNWALAGLIRLYQRGGFKIADKTKKIIEEMRGEQDNVRLFMIDSEYQIDKSGCFMTKKQIYQGYQNWCNEHGNRQVSAVNFWKRIQTMFGNSYTEERKRIGGEIPRMVNLKLPDDLKPEF